MLQNYLKIRMTFFLAAAMMLFQGLPILHADSETEMLLGLLKGITKHDNQGLTQDFLEQVMQTLGSGFKNLKPGQKAKLMQEFWRKDGTDAPTKDDLDPEDDWMEPFLEPIAQVRKILKTDEGRKLIQTLAMQLKQAMGNKPLNKQHSQSHTEL